MHLQVARTEELRPGRLQQVRTLLFDPFDGEFTDDDWLHALGGWHVIAGPVCSAHAAVVARVIDVGERRLQAGYVEGVATAPQPDLDLSRSMTCESRPGDDW